MLLDLWWLWLTISFVGPLLASLAFFGFTGPRTLHGLKAATVIASLTALSTLAVTTYLLLASWAIAQITTYIGYGPISEPLCLLFALILYPAFAGKYIAPIIKGRDERREGDLVAFRHLALFAIAFLSLFSPFVVYIHCHVHMIPIEGWFAWLLFFLFIVGVGAVARLFDVWK